MNPIKKKPGRKQILVILLSVLIHVIALFILFFIEIKYGPEKITGTRIQIDITTQSGDGEPQNKSVKKIIAKHIRKRKITVNNKTAIEEKVPLTIDTSSVNNKLKKPVISAASDTDKPDLKYASTLLDTFLIRHPEYAKYILRQHGKNLVKNKNNNMFSRLEAENMVNDELHKYLKENFPEGSEHAMNPNGGPGMQIPIDGLIDAIKKIFK